MAQVANNVDGGGSNKIVVDTGELNDVARTLRQSEIALDGLNKQIINNLDILFSSWSGEDAMELKNFMHNVVLLNLNKIVNNIADYRTCLSNIASAYNDGIK